MNKSIQATVVFQGGGAKGICHVGALQGIEEFNVRNSDARLDIVAYAGTSIGALVAALSAIGYTSSELINSNGELPICNDLKLSVPKDFLGPAEWFRIQVLRNFIRFFSSQKRLKWNKVLLVLIFTTFVSIVFYSSNYFVGAAIAFWLTNFCVIALGLIGSYYFSRGIGDFSPLSDIVNQALARKIGKSKSEIDRFMQDGVLFSDLASDEFDIDPLRIVATDATNGKMKVFSVSESPDVKISDAVVASMAIPGIVRSFPVGESRYFDGGLVSNTPAWTFDFDRTIDPDLVTLVFGIGVKKLASNSDDSGRKANWGHHLSMLYNAVHAGLVGESRLELKKSDRLFLIPLNPSKLELLDFDIGKRRVASYVNIANKFTIFALTKIFKLNKASLEFSAEKLRRVLLNKRKNTTGRNFRNIGNSKIYISVPINQRALKVFFAKSWSKELVDDRLLLPTDSTMSGQAFIEARPFLQCGSRGLSSKIFSRKRDRYRRAIKVIDHTWCYCCPIQTRMQSGKMSPPIGVLTIESDIPMSEFGLKQNLENESWDSIESVVNSEFYYAFNKFGRSHFDD